MMNFIGVIAILAVVAVLCLIGPIFTIMALNTLFGLGISVNIWTWLSAFWLTMIFTAAARVNKKKGE